MHTLVIKIQKREITLLNNVIFLHVVLTINVWRYDTHYHIHISNCYLPNSNITGITFEHVNYFSAKKISLNNASR